ncbi:MAG: hypothetical protein ACYS6K_16625 [Planctomycetota bacterium]|jgi:hypothetical protein
MDLDEILNKVSDFILSLQKLTNIWVFHATEDVKQEDVASILPSETGTALASHYDIQYYYTIICPASHKRESNGGIVDTAS